MTIDTTNFHNLEDAIQRSRTKQKNDLEDQLREQVKRYRERYSRKSFVQKRIQTLEEELQLKNQQLENLFEVWNRANFRNDHRAAEDARANRVDVESEIAEREEELERRKEEKAEADEFDPIEEGGELVQDFHTAKSLIAGNPRARCLSEDLERAVASVTQERSDAVVQRVKDNSTRRLVHK